MLLNLPPRQTLPPNPSTSPTSESTARPSVPTTAKVNPATLPKTHLRCAPEDWGWRELRDYVVYAITSMTGEFAGHSSGAAEAQIFKSFVTRFGKDAQRIARYALDTCDGVWYSQPVTIIDFCKNSDPQFAEPILKSLEVE